MPDLSPVTAQWFSLFNLYATVGIIVGAVVISWLVYTAVRYSRRKDEEPKDAIAEGVVPAARGHVGAALILTAVVAGILFTITLNTMQTVNLIEKGGEQGTYVIEVHSFQWGWRFIYPNGKVSIGEVRVPRDEVIVFKVTSDDVFHKFQLLEFKVGVDAIPGMTNKIWIKPTTSGTYTIQCFELCGFGHSRMKGRLVVMDPSDFSSWYTGT